MKEKLTKPLYIWLLLGLLAYGGLLRVYDLGASPYWMDEGYTINAVLSIEETGVSILDSGLPYTCPIYCYPTAWIAKAFGDSAVSYRALAAAAGIIFVGAMLYIVRNLLSVRIALVSSFIFAFSYWQIAWSRQARWYTLFSLFFWLALYFFYRTLKKDRHQYWYAVGTVICTILAILTHSIGFVLPFILITWAVADQVFFEKKWHWKKVAGVVGIGLLSLGAVSVAKPDFLLGALSKIELHYQLPYYLSFYLRTYWLFIPFMLIPLVGGAKEHKKESFFLLLVLLAYVIPLSFLTNVVQYRYLFHVTPVIVILSTLGMWMVFDYIKVRFLKVLYWLALIALFFGTGAGVLLPKTEYLLESDPPDIVGSRPFYASTPQPDWNSAYEYIELNQKEGDIIISSHPHFNKIFLKQPGYWIKYDYLGFEKTTSRVIDDREYYVGAKVIDDLAEFEAITGENHGFIVFDGMAIGRMPEDILVAMEQDMELVYHKQSGTVSEIWVYRF